MGGRILFRKLFLVASLTSALLLSACTQSQLKTTDDTASKESISNLSSLQSITLTESNKQIIRETFDSVKELQDKIRNGPAPSWVVEGEGVRISLSDYVLAKKNRDLVLTLNQVEDMPSDADLLQDTITTQLTQNYAKQSGIVVTLEEVKDAIQFQKKALDESDPTDPNQQLIRYVMENRIRITGLIEEEFWNSDEVYSAYETSLYNSKLIENILSDESMKGMDSYYELKEKLFNEFQSTHSIQVPDLNEVFQKTNL